VAPYQFWQAETENQTDGVRPPIESQAIPEKLKHKTWKAKSTVHWTICESVGSNPIGRSIKSFMRPSSSGRTFTP